MFSFFNATEAKNFGATAGQSILKKISETPKKRIGENKKEAAYNAAIKELEKSIISFKKKNKLNIYQKAQLGKTFKFTLIDGGCEAEFAERMTL